MLPSQVRRYFASSFRYSIRTVTTTISQQHPRNFGKPNAELQQDAEQKDLEIVSEIEANLFENSAHKGLPENTINTAKLLSQYRREEKKSQPLKATSNPVQRKFEQKKPEPSPVLRDPDLNLSYTKLKLNDPLFSKIMFLARSRRARDQRGRIIIEGRRLLLDAIAAGLQLETVLFAQKSHLMEIKDDIRRFQDCRIIRVPQQDLRSWSTLVTCPGVIAIFQRSTIDEEIWRASQRASLPITVICDNIREPNNLGSIVRSCAAIPCAEILVTKGCCDPWDTKALRGGCGAQFHQLIRDDVTWEGLEKRFFEETNGRKIEETVVFLAENNKKSSVLHRVPIIPYDEMVVGHAKRCVLVIGGETRGISEDAYRFSALAREKYPAYVGGSLHIPMSENVDSLNTASAVTLVLFELRKHLLRQSQQTDARTSALWC